MSRPSREDGGMQMHETEQPDSERLLRCRCSPYMNDHTARTCASASTQKTAPRRRGRRLPASIGCRQQNAEPNNKQKNWISSARGDMLSQKQRSGAAARQRPVASRRAARTPSPLCGRWDISKNKIRMDLGRSRYQVPTLARAAVGPSAPTPRRRRNGVETRSPRDLVADIDFHSER